jgi:curli production assembly/transport component CsgF
MERKLIFLAMIIFGTTCIAQQFSYKPVNPAFGGDTFNYNWLLSSATSQNGFKEPAEASTAQSALERFGTTLNQQVLSQISRSLLAQQLGSFGNFSQEGSFIFGSLNVEVFETLEGLVVNILDTLTGEETQIIIPNP